MRREKLEPGQPGDHGRTGGSGGHQHKRDLVYATRGRRAERGEVWVFDSQALRAGAVSRG